MEDRLFETCPCGSGKGYLACCGRIHSGAPAESAETLMRARYTAFTRGNAAFLLQSWAPETRPDKLELNPDISWEGLVIEAHKDTGPNAAFVRFTARWRKGRKTGRLTENSRFRRAGTSWVYVDDEIS